jgi:hypothetical protein
MHRNYELMVLLHPDLEIDVETPITKVEGLVSAAGGKVTKSDKVAKGAKRASADEGSETSVEEKAAVTNKEGAE